MKEEKLKPSAKALAELAEMNKRSINQNPIPWKQNDENLLKIASLNAMNLKTNFEGIVCDKTILQSTLIAFSETWLDEETKPLIDGYKSHFNNVGQGKGLAVYFKENIFKHVLNIKKETMQLMKLKSARLQAIAVYRSNQGNTVELLEHLIELITPGVNTVICGDFNICYQATRNNIVTKYLEGNGFTQLVKEATHIQGRLIDHFYMRIYENGQQSTSLYRYSPYYADHDAICTTIRFQEQDLTNLDSERQGPPT